MSYVVSSIALICWQLRMFGHVNRYMKTRTTSWNKEPNCVKCIVLHYYLCIMALELQHSAFSFLSTYCKSFTITTFADYFIAHLFHRYKASATILSKIHHDRPETPRDEAVFWVEYVMRNKGAKHLRVEAHNLTWYQYHCLDVFAFMIGIVLLVLFMFIKTCKFCFRRCCLRSNEKNKQEWGIFALHFFYFWMSF